MLGDVAGADREWEEGEGERGGDATREKAVKWTRCGTDKKRERKLSENKTEGTR